MSFVASDLAHLGFKIIDDNIHTSTQCSVVIYHVRLISFKGAYERSSLRNRDELLFSCGLRKEDQKCFDADSLFVVVFVRAGTR